MVSLLPPPTLGLESHTWRFRQVGYSFVSNLEWRGKHLTSCRCRSVIGWFQYRYQSNTSGKGLIVWLLPYTVSSKTKAQKSALSPWSCHVMLLWRTIMWSSRWGQHPENRPYIAKSWGVIKNTQWGHYHNTFIHSFEVWILVSTWLCNCLLFDQYCKRLDVAAVQTKLRRFGCLYLADALISADFISIPLHVFDLALHPAIC